MRIDKLSLQNFRCFKQLDITFDEHITVLVAPNGAGKTTVLDAVRLALWPYIDGIDVKKEEYTLSLFKAENVRIQYIPEKLNMEVVLPSSVEAEGQWGDNPIHRSWLISRDSVNDSALTPVHKDTVSRKLTDWAVVLQSQIRNESSSDFTPLPVILYLGTARLWYQDRYEPQLTEHRLDNSAFSRLSGYDDCLSATSSYKQFEQWYSWLWRSLREFQIKLLENTATDLTEGIRADRMKEAIQAIQQAINTLTKDATGWHSLEYSSSHNQQLVMSHPQHGKIPLAQLSDGLRNTVAMVADIAFRCVKLNPHLRDKAALETRGVVLIDEVDMFLHPAWQQRIIQSLRTAFPMLQFIVTTHSPQVLSTVKRESIRLLEQDDSGNGLALMPPGATYGEPSNDVLQSVMQVDPQPPVAEKADLEKLTALVDQGKYDELATRQLMDALKAALGESHPQLQRLQRSIARQNLLKGKF